MGARWVGIKILRHIPGEVARELGWLAHDLWPGLREPQAIRVMRDVVRFRYEKTVGPSAASWTAGA